MKSSSVRSVVDLGVLDVSGFDLETFRNDTFGSVIPRTGVLEHVGDVRKYVNSTLLASIGKACRAPSKVHLCEFSAIDLHVDTVLDGMRYAHLVLHGEFTMFIGDHEVNAKAGSFFEIDPRRPHSVYTDERIITLCMELLGE